MQGFIPANEHLQQALNTVHEASVQFSHPDPATRARGEATFLALRQSEGALEYACFALEHSKDPLVLFHSLNAVLFVLPSLPISQPRPQIASLSNLRDFLLQFSISRAEQAARAEAATPNPSSSWPQYVRARAYQTAIAVEKRLLGLELAQLASNNSGGSASGAQALIQAHVDLLNTQLGGLLHLPTPWPSDPLESALATARIITGLGLVKSVIDEFVLTTSSDLTANDQSGSSADRGKVKSVESGTPIGLSIVQHRWCKAVVQSHILPGLMSSAFNLLYSTISSGATTNDQIPAWRMAIFPQAVSAVERLLAWNFLHTDPFADYGSGAQSEEAALVAAAAEAAEEEDSAWSATSDNSGSRRFFKARRLPEQYYQVLLSADVVSLLVAAYRFGRGLLATVSSRDVAFSVHRLRQCFLLAASFAPADAGKPLLNPSDKAAVIGRAKFLSDTLQSLVTHECSGEHQSPLLSARGDSLLFLAQSYQILLNVNRVTDLAAALQDATGVAAFLSSLSVLGRTIFAFAFHRPRDTDEEDDLAVLAEDTTDTLLSCWQVLLSSLRAESDSASQQDLQVLWQAVHTSVRDDVFRPYVTGRMDAAAMPGDDDVSEHDEAAAKDRDVYSDQLITIAGLGRLSAAENLRMLAEIAQPLCEALASIAEGRQGAPDPSQLEKVWEQVHWLVLVAGHVLADEAKGETPEVPSEIASFVTSEQDDPAVSLLVLLGLRLLETLSVHGSASVQASSPQVMETLLWFVARWTATYLLIDDRSGLPTNKAIQSTFSGEAGQRVLSVLLQRLRENVQLWMADADVLIQIAGVLSSFTRSSGIMMHLLGLSEMESLVSALVSGLDSLPASTHGALVSAVVSCIYSGPGAERYLVEITRSIEGRFSALMQQVEGQRSDVLVALETSLDMLEGLAQAVQPHSAETLFGFIANFFSAFAYLCKVYATRAEVGVAVLRVLHTLAVSLELDFGAEEHIVTSLNGAVGEVLAVLKRTPALEEEEGDGMPLALELVCELAHSARASPGVAGRTADVCLQSLGVLTPSAAQLTLPRVRDGYMRLVSSCASLFGHRAHEVNLAEPLEAAVTAHLDDSRVLEAIPAFAPYASPALTHALVPTLLLDSTPIPPALLALRALVLQNPVTVQGAEDLIRACADSAVPRGNDERAWTRADREAAARLCDTWRYRVIRMRGSRVR